MRSDVQAYPNKDVRRSVTVELWKASTIAEVIEGTATGQVDLSNNVAKAKCTSTTLSVDLRFNNEFSACPDQPRPGELVTVKTDSVYRFIGIISSINSYTEERGSRTMSLTCRLRDGIGQWRSGRANSAVFPQGTSLTVMARDTCEVTMGMEASEFSFGEISYYVPHTNAQLSDEPPWSMLESILLAADMIPFVDVKNRVRSYRKDVTRASDVLIANDKTVKIHGTRETGRATKVRLKWLSSVLEESVQQDQVLYSTAMTSGFFTFSQHEETWFSSDRTQRAKNTYMVIKDSINAGLIPVASEEYSQVDMYHGNIHLTSYLWAPALAFAGIVAIAAEYITNYATAAVVFVMMSIGIGKYDIKGAPYDFVYAKNTTVAYAENVPLWSENEVEMENDLIVNEAHAQSVSVSHLVWLAAQGFAFGATIVDDPRIERGDILEFEDGSRLLVDDFTNDYTRGSAAVMEVSGFRV